MSLKSYQFAHGDQDQEQGLKLTSQWVNLKDLKITTVNNASAQTYTAASVVGGVILRTGSSTPSDVTPTAALIVAAIPNAAVGDTFTFWIRNAGSGTLTLTAGTNVTLSGTMTIATVNSKMFVGQVTAVGTPAVTIYSMGAASAY